MALVGMLVRNYASMVMRELGGRAGEWADEHAGAWVCRRINGAGVVCWCVSCAGMLVSELGGRAGEWAGRACWRLSRAGVLASGPDGRAGEWAARA